jgi:hypothetical protein
MTTEPVTAHEKPSTSGPHEIRVYMHAGSLYWCPVWFVGFIMAAWTLIENRHMALVPASGVVEGNTIVATKDVD